MEKIGRAALLALSLTACTQEPRVPRVACMTPGSNLEHVHEMIAVAKRESALPRPNVNVMSACTSSEADIALEYYQAEPQPVPRVYDFLAETAQTLHERERFSSDSTI